MFTNYRFNVYYGEFYIDYSCSTFLQNFRLEPGGTRCVFGASNFKTRELATFGVEPSILATNACSS